MILIRDVPNVGITGNPGWSFSYFEMDALELPSKAALQAPLSLMNMINVSGHCSTTFLLQR